MVFVSRHLLTYPRRILRTWVEDTVEMSVIRLVVTYRASSIFALLAFHKQEASGLLREGKSLINAAFIYGKLVITKEVVQVNLKEVRSPSFSHNLNSSIHHHLQPWTTSPTSVNSVVSLSKMTPTKPPLPKRSPLKPSERGAKL